MTLGLPVYVLLSNSLLLRITYAKTRITKVNGLGWNLANAGHIAVR
jgi:hypothetical protein